MDYSDYEGSFELEVRYSKNDQWTHLHLKDAEEAKAEVWHRVCTGWEVRIAESMGDLDI